MTRPRVVLLLSRRLIGARSMPQLPHASQRRRSMKVELEMVLDGQVPGVEGWEHWSTSWPASSLE